MRTGLLLRDARTRELILKVIVTFSSFTFSHQESSSMVTRIQQQPLGIFASHFAKVPSIKRIQTWKCAILKSDRIPTALLISSCARSRWSNEVIISGNDALLFSLDGVSRGHVITRDVAFPPRVDRASLPPVSFSARTTHDTWNKCFVHSNKPCYF